MLGTEVLLPSDGAVLPSLNQSGSEKLPREHYKIRNTGKTTDRQGVQQ